MKGFLRGMVASVFLLTASFSNVVPAHAQGSAPEVEWDKTYDGGGYAEGFSGQQTTDGGFVLVGTVAKDFESSGYTKAYVVKTDKNGKKVWDKSFAGEDWVKGLSIKQTQDGGYFLVGSAYVNNNSDVFVAKLDKDGKEEWSKTLGDKWLYEEGLDGLQTADGKFLVAGSAERPSVTGPTALDAYLLQLDKNGTIESEKFYGSKGSEFAHAISPTRDGGYILTGYVGMSSYALDLGDDLLMVKVDKSLKKEWEKTYGGDRQDRGNGVIQTDDGGYVAVGLTDGEYQFGFGDGYILKVDSRGTKKWEQKVNGSISKEDWMYSIEPLKNGNYLIGGVVNFDVLGTGDVYVQQMTPTGEMIWETTKGNDGGQFQVMARPTKDNGVVAIGTDLSYDRLTSSFYLIKYAGELLQLTSLTLSQTDGKVQTGDNLALQAIGHYSDDSTKNMTTELEWTSDNEAVATVKQGVVTGVKEGTAVITASTKDGQLKASGQITVEKAKKLTKLEAVDAKGKKLSSTTLKVGKEIQIYVKATFEDKTTQNVEANIEWESADSKVAEVTNGLVKAKKKGKTLVKGKYKNKTVSITITVK